MLGIHDGSSAWLPPADLCCKPAARPLRTKREIKCNISFLTLRPLRPSAPFMHSCLPTHIQRSAPRTSTPRTSEVPVSITSCSCAMTIRVQSCMRNSCGGRLSTADTPTTTRSQDTSGRRWRRSRSWTSPCTTSMASGHMIGKKLGVLRWLFSRGYTGQASRLVDKNALDAKCEVVD